MSDFGDTILPPWSYHHKIPTVQPEQHADPKPTILVVFEAQNVRPHSTQCSFVVPTVIQQAEHNRCASIDLDGPAKITSSTP